MPDRSPQITNLFTPLTEWGAYRDNLIAELTAAGWTNFENVIRSKFTYDHFLDPQMAADLIQEATGCHDSILTDLRSATDRFDIPLGVNLTRDRLDDAGSFTSSDGWTTPSGWTIVNSAAEGNIATGLSVALSHNIADIQPNSRYLIEFNMPTHIGGNVIPRILDTPNQDGPDQGGVGLKQVLLSSGSAPTGLAIVSEQQGGFRGSIDNLTIRLVEGGDIA